MRPIDHSAVIGQTFGRLTVADVGPPYEAASGRLTTRYLCTCHCGKTGILVRRDALLKGTTRSCGCIVEEQRLARQGRSPKFSQVSTHHDIQRILRYSNDF